MSARQRLGACAAAVLGCAASSALATGEPNHVPNKAPSGETKNPDTNFTLVAPPMYEGVPVIERAAPPDQAEPVLVPLPPGAWAALSGLVGLAAVAAWRKYRFRHE